SLEWDRQAHIWTAVFSYPPAEPDFPLREDIEETVGIVQRGYLIQAGPLEISLDSRKRIATMELRTNPAEWTRGIVQQPNSGLRDASIEILTEYDSNGIASIPVDVWVTWDDIGSRLSFRFRGDDDVEQWYCLGTDTAVGIFRDSA